MSAEKLYTPQVLGLAVELAEYPLIQAADVRGEARSSACGSTLAMALSLDEAGQVAQVGMRVQACAIGQAAAAIFARHAKGRTGPQIETAAADIRHWLETDAPLPGWPDLQLIAAARDYRGRHGAMMLPWMAAVSALSTQPASR